MDSGGGVIFFHFILQDALMQVMVDIPKTMFMYAAVAKLCEL